MILLKEKVVYEDDIVSKRDLSTVINKFIVSGYVNEETPAEQRLKELIENKLHQFFIGLLGDAFDVCMERYGDSRIGFYRYHPELDIDFNIPFNEVDSSEKIYTIYFKLPNSPIKIPDESVNTFFSGDRGLMDELKYLVREVLITRDNRCKLISDLLGDPRFKESPVDFYLKYTKETGITYKELSEIPLLLDIYNYMFGKLTFAGDKFKEMADYLKLTLGH